ncbi:Cation/H+ exchanger [Staphylotrichum tortipilum]|uniref:Cation/H+ exchanger n=1 Tax=Staphylotrichum tortipilum TaxID=2831512 RepID=A0AAN6RVG2_9PEZI|nr:Cation/H+ exchanger [Staphylotrichum longicolle]
MAADASDGAFLAYHEPSIISILTLITFFLVLAVAEWLADKAVRASLIGHIVVGLIYGVPLGNILPGNWQETFLALGYIGLLLIIFEGGLTIRLDLLSQNLVLSIVAALLGVLTPIALSFALLHAGFHHSALESFIVGVALCSTSLGTTFVILSGASNPPAPDAPAVEYAETRVGTVLVSAAVLDDVCGLVLVSVIHNLRDIAAEDHEGGGAGLGWIIGRPVLASVLMAVLTPVVAKFVAGPVYRRFGAPQAGYVVNIALMAVFMCAFLAIAAYAGASVLFGAFLAGAFLSSLAGDGSKDAGCSREMPGFVDTFDKYLGQVQNIGFAIPFLDLWTGEVMWKGILYTLLMVLAKLVVGLVVPAWDFLSSRLRRTPGEGPRTLAASWAPATLLGAAMVARGEIGLLIIQIGLSETPFLTQKAFVIGVWAIVLNTIIGPVLVGVLLKRVGADIASDPRWGVQAKQGSETDGEGVAEPTDTPAGTSLESALAC